MRFGHVAASLPGETPRFRRLSSSQRQNVRQWSWTFEGAAAASNAGGRGRPAALLQPGQHAGRAGDSLQRRVDDEEDEDGGGGGERDPEQSESVHVRYLLGEGPFRGMRFIPQMVRIGGVACDRPLGQTRSPKGQWSSPVARVDDRPSLFQRRSTSPSQRSDSRNMPTSTARSVRSSSQSIRSSTNARLSG
jgi:hypothetical protein